jgi:hypothetical protein
MARRRRKPSFRKLWSDYLKACERVANEHRDDHRFAYLAPTLVFQHHVLLMARSQDAVTTLQQSWYVLQIVNPEAAAALEQELQSYPALVQRSAEDATTTPDRDPAERRRSLLGIAGIVTGSVKDLFENLPPIGKQMLTVLRELWDMLKEA